MKFVVSRVSTVLWLIESRVLYTGWTFCIQWSEVVAVINRAVEKQE